MAEKMEDTTNAGGTDESSKESALKDEMVDSGNEGSEEKDFSKDVSQKGSEKNDESVKEEKNAANKKKESVDEMATKDDSDEESEEEVGLLDRPVEVSGCRARKKVERLEVSFSVTKEKYEITEGKGQKLGDCSRIEDNIKKHSVTDLKLLHKLLFNRVGQAFIVKKNLRKFSGFPFAKDSKEFEKRKSSLEKLSMANLKNICSVLDIDRGGSKDEIVTRILEFCLKPADSGKPLKKPKKKTTKKVKVTEKKSKEKKEASSEDESESVDDSDGGQASDEGGSDSDPKKSKDVKRKKTLNKKKVKKSTKEDGDKGIKRKREMKSDSDSDDEGPAAKKAKVPSDEEIKTLVQNILNDANLQEVTMKRVIKQVSESFPESDLEHKKPFIKATIKSLLKKMYENKH